MKKILLLIILSFLAFTTIRAQNKMNFSFGRNSEEKETNMDEQVSMLIQGNVSQIKALVTEVGGKFRYSAGNNIASVSMSIHQLSQIISNKAIQRVEAFPPSIKPLNDSVLKNADILPVHTGQVPLPQAYDGTGVIVGFIDTGIDLTHADFQDASGKTRVLWLWDQSKTSGGITSTVPCGGYGQEWSKADIDAGLAVSHTDPTGHGTHVAGVAVGNGLATGTFLGVAPKADIIVVALNFGPSPPNPPIQASANVDAVCYIYSKAKALNKPCVINASVGSDYGLHDGRDLESQAIKKLIIQDSGQAFIAAAGNSVKLGKCHVGYTVSATDTNFTLFKPLLFHGKYYVYMDIVADSNSLKPIQFAIGADNMAPSHSFRGNIPFKTVSAMPIGAVVTTLLKNAANQPIGQIKSYLYTVNGDYDLQFYITADSTTYDWRLMAKGVAGSFDLWNFLPDGSQYSPIVSSIPTKATMPDSMYYKYPDADKSIEGGFQCLDEVVAVNNYQNRRSYTDCNNNPFFSATFVVGQLTINSTIGPTRDGRIKPDIAAPGDMVMAALSIAVPAGFRPPTKVAKGCKHIRDGGTSHACPVVAGIAALYLQKNPKATAMQVKQAIIRCTIKDNFTGNSLPDNYWGYGKVDGFRTLTDCITIVITTQPHDSSICKNANATFTIAASGTGLTYQWQVDQGAGFLNLTNTAPYNGVNTDTLTISSAAIGLNGYHYRCVVNDMYLYTATSNSGTLTVNSLPTITGTLTVCAGLTSTLTGSATAAIVSPWISSNTAVATVSSTGVVTGVSAGTSTITYTNTNGCVQTTTVTINSLPVVTSGGLAASYCYNDSVQTLTGSPAGGTFSGKGITNGASGTFNPVIAGSGLKKITYMFTNGNNCTDSSSQSTRVLTQAASLDSCQIIVASGIDKSVANIFTPNNDGINDEFKINYTGIPASDFNLNIFDRWGTLVFTSTSPNSKWDGRTTAGLKVSQGTYFYVLVNAGINYKGSILLLE